MAEQKKTNRLHRVARGAAFALAVLSLSAGAVRPAATVRGAEPSQESKTKVNVGVTELTKENVSFEVPLYYVICVTQEPGKAAKVTCPSAEKYCIVNKSTGNQRVAVTQVGVQGVTGGTWSLVSEADLAAAAAAEKKIRMTVGGIELPAVAAGATGLTTKPTKTDAVKNSFYISNEHKYLTLGTYDAADPDDSTIEIPVTAQVSPAYQVTKNAQPAAQFRLCYTVSPVNGNGDVLTAD